MKSTLNGYGFEIPDGETTKAVLALVPAGHVPYLMTQDGRHQIIKGDEEVCERDRFGTVARFTQGARDIERIKIELTLLEKEYGEEAVTWAHDYSWVAVDTFRLPPGYNRRSTSILILFPEQYGTGAGFRDFFVQVGLRHQRGMLPHFFERYPYGDRDNAFVAELKSKGWAYVCLHQDAWTPRDTILTYLTQVYTWMSDPFTE